MILLGLLLETTLSHIQSLLYYEEQNLDKNSLLSANCTISGIYEDDSFYDRFLREKSWQIKQNISLQF